MPGDGLVQNNGGCQDQIPLGKRESNPWLRPDSVSLDGSGATRKCLRRLGSTAAIIEVVEIHSRGSGPTGSFNRDRRGELGCGDTTDRGSSASGIRRQKRNAKSSTM